LNDSLLGLGKLKHARTRIEALMAALPDDAEIQSMGEDAITAIGDWEAKVTQLKHQTYEDEDAWESMLAAQVRYLLNVIDSTGPPVTDGAVIRLNDLQAEWAQRESEMRSIVAEHIQPINDWAKARQIDHVMLN